jgi:hypothetical protein
MTASYADTKRRCLSQRAPIARAGQVRANATATRVRDIIDAPATVDLQNNERRPCRRQPGQLRAVPRSAALAATTALKSP